MTTAGAQLCLWHHNCSQTDPADKLVVKIKGSHIQPCHRTNKVQNAAQPSAQCLPALLPVWVASTTCRLCQTTELGTSSWQGQTSRALHYYLLCTFWQLRVGVCECTCAARWPYVDGVAYFEGGRWQGVVRDALLDANVRPDPVLHRE